LAIVYAKQLDDAFRRPNLATVSVKLERLP